MSDPNTDLLDDTSSTGSDTTTYLDQLVGEGKQFKDANAVAKAKVDSDNFIKTLQKENREMVDKLKDAEKRADTKVAITDVLNELKNRAPTENSNQPAISEDEIARRIREQFDTYTASKQEAANKASANMALLKKFDGDAEKAKTFLANRISELGITSGTVTALAKSSPTAFAELLGLTPKETTTNTGGVVVRASATVVPTDALRNTTYYDGLLKSMGAGKFYADKNLLNQREQDITRLGDRFFA